MLLVRPIITLSDLNNASWYAYSRTSTFSSTSSRPSTQETQQQGSSRFTNLIINRAVPFWLVFLPWVRVNGPGQAAGRRPVVFCRWEKGRALCGLLLHASPHLFLEEGDHCLAAGYRAGIAGRGEELSIGSVFSCGGPFGGMGVKGDLQLFRDGFSRGSIESRGLTFSWPQARLR